MLEFGMPALIELPEAEDCARLCGELGLQFVELNMNMPHYQVNVMNVEKLRRTAEKYHIYYTIHLDENLNVSDFNPYVSEAYSRTVQETIQIAKQLHTPTLNMHLSQGVYFTLPDRKVYLFEEYRQQYLQTIKTFRDACEKSIGESGLKICVENSSGYSSFQEQALQVLLESPVFALTFDIGHNHCIGGRDEAVIAGHGERLCHFHFHDAASGKDHLPLGTGEIDLGKYLDMARERGARIVLETKTIAGLKASAEWIKKRDF